MRIAIIADIHGNIHALENVLKDLDAQHVDRIIVNGDLVNRGPNSLAVLKRLAPLGFPTTRGNHEDFLTYFVDRSREELARDGFDLPFWESTRRLALDLAEQGWTPYMAGLQMVYPIRIEGAPEVLVAHGTPRHFREGLGRFTPEDVLDALIAEHPAAVYIGSHIHSPWQVRRNGHIFVNTGAVGMPFNKDTRAQYLIIELRDEGWHFEFRAVEYDHAAALAAYEQTGFLQPDDLATMIFREEMRQARSFFGPYWYWAGQEGLKPGWESWRRYQRENPERVAGIPW